MQFKGKIIEALPMVTGQSEKKRTIDTIISTAAGYAECNTAVLKCI